VGLIWDGSQFVTNSAEYGQNIRLGIFLIANREIGTSIMAAHFSTSIFTLVVIFSSTVQAGTKIENQDSSKDGMGNLYIQDGKLATVNDQGQTQFIFDRKLNAVTVLQHAQQRYLQFDQQSLAAMAGGLSNMRNQAMSMMQQQMAGLSAEQRQQMEKMMGSMMPTPAAEQPVAELKESSQTDRLDGVSCRWVEVWQEGRKTSEACVAKLSDTKLDQDDFQTLQGFFAMIEQVVSEFAGAGQEMQLNKLMFDNNRVPLKIKDHSQTAAKDYNLKFDSGTFDAALFTVPKGYQRQSMPNMSFSGH
jgi:hypothetical protein